MRKMRKDKLENYFFSLFLALSASAFVLKTLKIPNPLRIYFLEDDSLVIRNFDLKGSFPPPNFLLTIEKLKQYPLNNFPFRLNTPVRGTQ